MRRTPEHLADVLAFTGEPDGTTDIVALVERGMRLANEARQAERAEQGKDLKTNCYVTDAGKECDRQVVYSLLNYPADGLTTDSLVNFAVGSAAEEAFAGFMSKAGCEIVRELRIEIPAGNTVVTGRVDMLLLNPDDRTMIELKTTSSRSMGYMLKRGVNQSYVKQINQYLHASQLGLLEGPDGALEPFDEGYVVVIVKDAVIREPPIHAWKVTYDKDMAESDLGRLDGLYGRALDRNIPLIPKGYEWGKWPCNYCNFRTFCYSGERASEREG